MLRIERGADDVVDGVSCYQVAGVTAAGVPVRYWITKDTFIMIRMEEAPPAADPNAAPIVTTVEWKARLDAPVEASMFQFEAPPK